MCGALSSLPVKAEKKLVREFRKPRIETGDFLRQAGVESGESNPATMPLKPKSPESCWPLPVVGDDMANCLCARSTQLCSKKLRSHESDAMRSVSNFFRTHKCHKTA